MPDSIPSCFRGGGATTPPASIAAGPNLTTSIYETHLGLAALTWSRTVFGLSLRVDLRLPSSSYSSAAASDCSSVSSSAAVECDDSALRFRVRPWILWKRRGSKKFHVKCPQPRSVELAWDLTRAGFQEGGSPEPSAGFFVAIAVDGDLFLVVGDAEEEAYKKLKAMNPLPTKPLLISRREHVVLPCSGGRPYTTRARIGGKEREISIDMGSAIGEKDWRMCLGIDGKRVLQVKRLKWKFRGSERIEVEGGARIQVSWDVHNWLFERKEVDDSTSSSSTAAASDLGHAVFVFRFERDEEEKDKNAGTPTCNPASGGGLWRFYGVGSIGMTDKSSGSIIGGGGSVGKSRVVKKSLLKTSSSSSSSSASSGSSSSVMEWSSAEENELQGSDGYSLLVYLWKS